jgi:thiol:disulfide interchange protein
LFLALAAAGCDAQGPRSTPIAKRPAPPPHEVVAPFAEDFAAALATAAKEQRPLLIFFTADWCSYCRQLRQEVFTRPEFRDAAKKFVCVQVDAGKHASRCEEYRVRAYPTLIFANPGGTAIERIVGITTPTVVLAQMNAAAASVVAAREERDTSTIAR